ncbi:MAG: fimbrillin family protein [Bacteroidales bacterium]|nr:fimbrillin family protein [Candidatus Liminaster caballi]
MKQILLVLICIMSLFSCSNEISDSFKTADDGRKPIKVDTYAMGVTKADAITIDDIKQNSFWLYADIDGDGTNVIDDYVWWDEETQEWIIGDGQTTYYWPEDISSKVTFYAVTATDCDLSEGDGSPFNSDIVVSGMVLDGDRDYVTAMQTVSLAANPSGTVTLNFGHILAAVKILARGTSEAHIHTIGPIFLYGFVSQAGYYITDKMFFYEPIEVDFEDWENMMNHRLEMNDSYLIADVFRYGNGYELDLEKYIEVSDTKFILPDIEYPLEVYYFVRPLDGVQTYYPSKFAKFTPKAGCMNILKIDLSPEATEISVDVVPMADWKNNNTDTPNLND